MIQLAEPHAAYLTAFESLRLIETSSQVADLRTQGFARFSALGFPTTKIERWRFTNVAAIASSDFRLGEAEEVESSAVASYELEGVVGPQLVFVNGRFNAALSRTDDLPPGVEIGSLAEALTSKPETVLGHLGSLAQFNSQPFTALNTAFLHDGAVVHVSDHAIIEMPVHLLFLTTDTPDQMNHPRVLVIAGENSQVRVVESYVGLGNARYFTNAVTEVVVRDSAIVDHYKLTRDSAAAYHIGSTHVRLGRSSNFSSHSITLGGELVCNDVDAELMGEGGECTLNGLYLVDARRLVDNHTTIRHMNPHCASHELYKGILNDEARGVFNGKIIVAIDAQKTDAKQTNKALLLSEDAQINTKPELEIFADDVKCTHGATVGQLDEDALFYLRSRGLELDQARSMLIHAFASDLLQRITIDSIRLQLDAILLQQLRGSGGPTIYEQPA